MKTRNFAMVLSAVAVAALGASSALAQNSSSANTAQPAAVTTSGSQMVYGVPQIIRLSQAKVSDDTIIAYVKNSGLSYSLDADQILYLRQQGVSEAVITAMLNQPKTTVTFATTATAPQPAAPAPQPVAASTVVPVATTAVAPTVTYIQTAPAPIYYYQPYYYPTYGVYPALSLSFAWGNTWHGGGYNHGGYYGGWHH